MPDCRFSLLEARFAIAEGAVFAKLTRDAILFSIACVVVTLAGQSSLFTTVCAFAYLGARVLYIPAYAFGWVPWRSLIWAVGYLATAAMLVAALI